MSMAWVDGTDQVLVVHSNGDWHAVQGICSHEYFELDKGFLTAGHAHLRPASVTLRPSERGAARSTGRAAAGGLPRRHRGRPGAHRGPRRPAGGQRMTRRVLVTGAAGNIGSVVMHDLAGDFDLVGLDVAEAPGVAGRRRRRLRRAPAASRRHRHGRPSRCGPEPVGAMGLGPPQQHHRDAQRVRGGRPAGRPTRRVRELPPVHDRLGVRGAVGVRAGGRSAAVRLPAARRDRRLPPERRLRREQGVGRGPRPRLLGPPRAVGHLPADRPLHPRRQPAAELAVALAEPRRRGPGHRRVDLARRTTCASASTTSSRTTRT